MAERASRHHHDFLSQGHAKAERGAWAVVWLCTATMVVEIVGGWLFGSLALIADGMHMSTHAGALVLAALAYRLARKHQGDERFTFGAGKFGDLAGYTSAIILTMIALLIAYEAALRLMAPTPIAFAEAIPIAVLGLGVNLASAWLLGHDHDHPGHDEAHSLALGSGDATLEIFEQGQPPRFRLTGAGPLDPARVTLETVRAGGARQSFGFVACDGFLQSREDIPEPHAFHVELTVEGERHALAFEEHAHGVGHDNNLRAAVVHVVADAAVSVLVIAGLGLAWAFGWLWMDAAAGLVGAVVIASWAVTLVRDTGAILLDMNPDPAMTQRIRALVEAEGDQLTDLHLWRLGPGHLGAIVAIETQAQRSEADIRAKLSRFRALSHLTIEIRRADLAEA